MHQFEKELCDNCWSEWTDGTSPSETSDAKKRTAAEDNTTDDFVGQVAMLRPDDSWVARWLRMHKSASSSSARVSFKPGLYAISLPTDEAQQAQQEEGGGGGEGGEDDEMDRGNREEREGDDEEEEEDKDFIDDGADEGGDDDEDDEEEEEDEDKGKNKGAKRGGKEKGKAEAEEEGGGDDT